jgi:hypothetical protein
LYHKSVPVGMKCQKITAINRELPDAGNTYKRSPE